MTWLILLALASPLSASADPGVDGFPIPPHHTIHEVLRNGSKVGEVHSQLSRDQRGVWYFDTETVATSRMARLLGLSAEESAHFLWRDDKVMSLTYRQVSRAPLRTRFWQHQNDWEQQTANIKTHEGDLTLTLEDDLLDPLTLRLQLAAMMHDADNHGRDLAFRVLERDEIEDQSIFFRGRETLSNNLGCFDTIKIQRFRREGSSRNYRAWLAEELNWMPLRIEIHRDDDEVIALNLIDTDIHLTNPNCN